MDTSRYECVDGHTVERPLPNEDHALIQYAVTTLLRERAKAHQTMAEMRLKAQRYFKWGVRHVWIIDPANIRDGALEAAGFRLEPADVFNFE